MLKFRPILSAINTPGYNLAKFLIPILEPLTHNEFAVKDSFSFVREITKYDSSFFMASLDVKSLFTNIPLKIFTTGNSTNLTYSNFWKQQPVNICLFFIFFSLNK